MEYNNKFVIVYLIHIHNYIPQIKDKVTLKIYIYYIFICCTGSSLLQWFFPCSVEWWPLLLKWGLLLALASLILQHKL